MNNKAMAGQTNTNIIIGVVVVLLVLVVIGFMVFGMNREVADVDEINVDTTDEEQLDLIEEQPLSATVSASPVVSPSPSATIPMKSIAVVASSFQFNPAEIRVKMGDTVQVALTNNSTMPHDFKIDELNVETKTITNGQVDTVMFVANKKGTFEYYCSVGTHRQQGMVGKLIVE